MLQPKIDNWTILAEEGKLEEAIFQFILSFSEVTFGELIKALTSCSAIPISGKCLITVSNNPNLVLWDDVSEEFATALSNLFEAQKISALSTSEMAYYLDSSGLDLPIASNLEPKTPHWLPVTLSLKLNPEIWNIQKLLRT